MNDEDLRDLFAGLAMQGILSKASSGYNRNRVAKISYELAEAMIEAKYAEPEDEAEEVGIASIKPKRKRGNDVSPTENIT